SFGRLHFVSVFNVHIYCLYILIISPKIRLERKEGWHMKAILTISGEDKIGIIAQISKILAEEEIDILNIS
ncbi:hypothetical protein PUV51_07280, partial [Lactobacillus helveticus DSM 20075 = CGMCC 1.1877]|nr:hypothetical protein [Lactobacillus helveticus DSM 20075 = CGMCC 1.1877]